MSMFDCKPIESLGKMLKGTAATTPQAISGDESTLRLSKVLSYSAGPPRTAHVDINGNSSTDYIVDVVTHNDPVVGEGLWIQRMGNGRWLGVFTYPAAAAEGTGGGGGGETLSVATLTVPSVTASTVTQGMQIGDVFSFNPAGIAAGGGGYLLGIALQDASRSIGGVYCLFFRNSVVAGNHAQNYSPSDAENDLLICTLPLVTYDRPVNRFADWSGARPFDCVGTTLYGLLVASTASQSGSFGANSLKMIIHYRVVTP